MAEPNAFWTFLPLLPLRLRNIALDVLFYDVGNLTPVELANLLLVDAQKGSVVVVSPGSANKAIRYYQRALRFIHRERRTIRAVAVAGVGSSIVGAASLARNVADALGEDVAAIVSGYGVADVVDEALGGAFVFGLADMARRGAEDVLQMLLKPASREPAARGELTIPSNWLDPSSPGLGLPGDDDATTLSDILLSNPPKLDLLVGHSKGSLIIDAALEDYVSALQGDSSDLYRRIRVLTLGAVSDIPSRFGDVTQVLGSFDWFGGLNSRLDLPHKAWPLSWHHLNTRLPWSLDAIEAIRMFGNTPRQH